MATKVKQVAPVEPERAYTYKQAGEFVNASERQVRRWCDERRIGYIRMPQGRRILGRHINEFLASREVKPVA